MAIEDVFRALQEFDVNDLNFDNIGSWPLAVKILVWLIALIGVLVLGYFVRVENLRVTLQEATARERDLRREFEQKAFQTANLDAYKKQMAEMEDSFGSLVSQLPSDIEVPGLLEDITEKGVRNGLEFDRINLLPEDPREFYIELPIEIVAAGTYHNLGAFVSGMAGLPRIVTLHDFKITRQSSDNAVLNLAITAKTYRYKEEEQQ